MTELDAASRVALVAGAATVTGPGASPSVIEATVVDLALMADPDSLVMKRLVRIQGAQRFVAELVDVTIEQSSTRAVLSFPTTDLERHPNGLETMRTERTDQPDGMSMYRRALGLKGHRVLVFKELQDTNDPKKKVRICLHLIDLGAPDDKPDIDPSREQAVNVRVVADANGEVVPAPGPDEHDPAKEAEREATAAYNATSKANADHNWLTYWSTKKGWSIPEMISALQRVPEGREVTSLRTVDPRSPAGYALETILERGKKVNA
jgi:hypothetical protein